MARVLCINYNKVTPPGRDDKLTLKRGDAICVKPDQHIFNDNEQSDSYVIIDLPSVPVAELLYLVERSLDPIRKLSLDPMSKPVCNRLRKRRVNLDHLNAADHAAMRRPENSNSKKLGVLRRRVEELGD